MQLFFTGFLLCLSLCLDIGVVNVMMIKTGIERGFGPSFMIGLGSTIGDLVYVVVSTLGISLLLNLVYVEWVLWIGGTLILLYFCVKMFVEVLRPKVLSVSGGPFVSGGRNWSKDLLGGIGLALSSPTAILWFASIGGSVIATTTRNDSSIALGVFFAGFTCGSLVWSLFIGVSSGWIGKRAGSQFVRVLSFISAILFLYFGIRVFLHGVRTLLS